MFDKDDFFQVNDSESISEIWYYFFSACQLSNINSIEVAIEEKLQLSFARKIWKTRQLFAILPTAIKMFFPSPNHRFAFINASRLLSIIIKFLSVFLSLSLSVYVSQTKYQRKEKRKFDIPCIFLAKNIKSPEWRSAPIYMIRTSGPTSKYCIWRNEKPGEYTVDARGCVYRY